MSSTGLANRQAGRHFLEVARRSSAPAQQQWPVCARQAAGARAGPQTWPAVIAHRGRTPCHRRRHGIVASADPQELMRHLEKELGVRFVAAGGDEDEEEELDDWEDVVGELGNPLDMRPARVGLMDDDLDYGVDPATEMAAALAAAGGREEEADDDGRLPLPALPPSAAAVAGAAAAAAGAGAASSSSGASAYLDPSALPRVGRGELLQLAAHGGSVPGKAAVALVDVREASELAAPPRADGSSSSGGSSTSTGGCGGGSGGCGGGGGCSGSASASAATSLAPWGSQQQHVIVRHVPLSELRRPQAEALAEAADYVAVAATGDHRGEQAVVRLGKVYGLRRVVLYDEAEE